MTPDRDRETVTADRRLRLPVSTLHLLAAQGGGRRAAEALQAAQEVQEASGQWLDVAYAAGSPAQRLDLYLPATGEGPFPVVVWVHGGAWLGGSKTLGPRAFQRRVLERGYALASVGYRLSSEATFPAQIHDVKTAVRHLRAQAARYGLDGSRMAGWGDSAGGHLVALLGTSAGVAELEGADPGHAGASSRIQAVVDWYGPTDFLQMDDHARAAGCGGPGVLVHASPDSPESRLLGGAITTRPDEVRLANPATHATRDAPPFLIQHGTRDCVVAYPQSVLLRDALEAAAEASRVELDLLEGAGHRGPAFIAAANLDRVLDFLDRHLGPRVTGP
jgi:acetyl esterase/lipase